MITIKETRRNYDEPDTHPEAETITVGELITALKKYNADMPIAIDVHDLETVAAEDADCLFTVENGMMIF